MPVPYVVNVKLHLMSARLPAHMAARNMNRWQRLARTAVLVI